MKFRDHSKTVLFVVALALGAGTVALQVGRSGASLVSVKVPEFSRLAVLGQKAFDESCAGCHGTNGAGADLGPPLVHDIYNPGHHADTAFILAAKQGVRQHHWRFGNMPAQPHVSDGQMAAIIRYVRELQQANGIVYRRHRM
jgi:cytochrome c